MPRGPRTLIAGYPHHVVQRGHNRQPVFSTERDRLYYLDNLAEQLELRDIALHAWCLMTNHVHLLLEPRVSGSDISALMRVLAARQTRRFNRIEIRTGTLWESRFKCSVVDSETWLWACCRYIETNPVRAGLVANAADYRWSSFRERMAGIAGNSPAHKLTVAPLCDTASYLAYVGDAMTADEAALIRTSLARNQCTGGQSFRSKVEARLGRHVSHRGPGRPANREK